MNWKWFAAGAALLTASILGMASYGDELSVISRAGQIRSGKESISATDPVRFSGQAEYGSRLTLTPYAQQMKAALTTPGKSGVHVRGVLELSGTVGEYRRLAAQMVWVRVEYTGSARTGLPNRIEYYLPLSEGRFQQKIRLFQGRGTYRVEVRLPGTDSDEYYYPMVAFTAVNLDDSIGRDIAYSVSARKAGLVIATPESGYESVRKEIRLKGRISGDRREVLVQLKKDGQVWKKMLSVHNGRFDEPIPLLYGQGLHELQVMVPDEKRPGYFVEGATLFVNNLWNRVLEPIVYTRLYEERGIRLTTPAAGGDLADLTMRIGGTINPNAKYADRTTHLIVQTKKGKDEATYFIPVKDYRFDGKIWFRFGPGTYEITLFVPEITTENRDYFRFFTVAGFRMESRVKEDLRHLLPSRGIESDHPSVRRLAESLTAGRGGDLAKARAIYRYVAKNMSYDMDKYRNNTFSWDDSALKSLRTRSGVCQDYAFLVIALLRASGIPARFIEGEAGGQRHAWVEAYVNGRWVTMDPTWGSGYITSDGQYVKKYDERWFDPSPEEFARTHRRTGVMY
jgi:hypothetical protein